MKRRGLFSVAVLTLLGATAPAASAQAHPDFSGKWVMDTVKSEPSPLTPQGMTWVVRQSGNQIKADRTITVAGGASTATLVWAVDGKPWKNEWQQSGLPVAGVSTLSWDGATLVVKTDVAAGGQTVSQGDRWTLAPDGKSMTIERSIDVNGQHMSAKLLMNKAR